MASRLCQEGGSGKPGCAAIPIDTSRLSKQSGKAACSGFYGCHSYQVLKWLPQCSSPSCKLMLSYHRQYETPFWETNADCPWISTPEIVLTCHTEARDPTANSSAFKRSLLNSKDFQTLSPNQKMSGLHSQRYLPWFQEQAHPWRALFSGWHHHRACGEWREPLGSRESRDTGPNSLRAQDEEGSGVFLQEEDDSRSPGEFLHSEDGSLATQRSYARAGDAGLSLSLGYPAARGPEPSDSHAHGAIRTFPRTTLTIQRAYYLQVSPDTFCCAVPCSCFVSNILGPSLKHPGRRLSCWPHTTERQTAAS